MTAYVPKKQKKHGVVARLNGRKLRSKARYDRLKAEGICVGCGKVPRDTTAYCRACLQKTMQSQYDHGHRKSEPRGEQHGTPHQSTTTGQHYRVIQTGEIGRVMPCPANNPVIIEFLDGRRAVCFLRELEPTPHPITRTKKVDTVSYAVSNKGDHETKQA